MNYRKWVKDRVIIAAFGGENGGMGSAGGKAMVFLRGTEQHCRPAVLCRCPVKMLWGEGHRSQGPAGCARQGQQALDASRLKLA